MILTAFICTSSYSYLDEYPPFQSPKETFKSLGELNPTIDLEDSKEVRVQALTIKKEKSEEAWIVRLYYKGRAVGTVNSDGKWPFVGSIYLHDFDSNGFDDLLVVGSYTSNGLDAYRDQVAILLQSKPGIFKRIDYQTYMFSPKDFTDLDNDGKYELLIMDHAGLEGNDGKLHSFWVYASYKITNKGLNLLKTKKYPRFIWHTENPNDEETNKLSEAQKNEYVKNKITRAYRLR